MNLSVFSLKSILPLRGRQRSFAASAPAQLARRRYRARTDSNMLVARMLPRSGFLVYSSILWLKSPFAAKPARYIYQKSIRPLFLKKVIYNVYNSSLEIHLTSLIYSGI